MGAALPGYVVSSSTRLTSNTVRLRSTARVNVL